MNTQLYGDPGIEACSCWGRFDPMCWRGLVIGNHPLRSQTSSYKIAETFFNPTPPQIVHAPPPKRQLTIHDIQRLGGYSIIYADCPWNYDDQNCNGAAEQQYRTLTFAQLCSMPVRHIAAQNSALFLWATYPKIQDALNLIPYWGFEFKSYAFDWIKLRGGRPQMGLGRWTRGASEVCLLAVRGKPQRQDKGVRQLLETIVNDHEHENILYAPATRHSQKPPEVRERIVQLMGDLPRLEMFARERAVGWDCWGNETPQGSDIVLV